MNHQKTHIVFLGPASIQGGIILTEHCAKMIVDCDFHLPFHKLLDTASKVD